MADTILDPLFLAISLSNRRQLEDAAVQCTKVLDKNALDQSAWYLKLRCLSEQVYVDEVENDEQGIADMLIDDSVLAKMPRPGTSLMRPATSTDPKSLNQVIRPRSSFGRPLSGVLRPGTTGGGRPGTIEQALRTSRTATTARPVSSASGRYVRLGTASMLSNPDGKFINLARLNIDKYGADRLLNRALFEYIFYHEGDIRMAHQLASVATKAADYNDWYWKVQLGKCYYRLGMYRDAEKQYVSALKQQKMIDTILLLAKVYIRLDQPQSAIEQYKLGLDTFTNDVSLLTALARIYEQLDDDEKSIATYKLVLKQEANNIEAIACIGMHLFYSDQPEIALRYYRRIRQMGVQNAELFTNIGLCCFYAQQWDLAMGCFERAQSIADEHTAADVWYNIGHVALASGDLDMASRCFRLALTADAHHSEAYCNLGVLEMHHGRIEQARALFQSAIAEQQHSFEPYFNLALLDYRLGNFQSSYESVQKVLQLYPEHSDSLQISKKIQQMFNAI